jgi:hypothetical protein
VSPWSVGKFGSCKTKQQTADTTTQKRKNTTARERMNLSHGVAFLAVAEADQWQICRVAL